MALCALDSAAFAGLPDLPWGLGAAYVIAGYAPLAWRRAAPVPVFLALSAHQIVAGIWMPEYRPMLGLLAALFTLAVTARTRVSLAALAISYGGLTAASLQTELRQGSGLGTMSRPAIVALDLVAYGLVTVVAWGTGRWVRRSRATIDDLELRRARAAAEAVRTERQRVARDLHDIVSHSVSVIVLQAAGAQRVMAREPARAQEALAHIENVGKETMVELRRLLGVLHDGALSEPGDGEPANPQPGLVDLMELIQGMRRSGLEIELLEQGERTRLEPSVDLSAYRIVQEALTNSLKHAGPQARVTIHLRWTSERLLIEVVDDGGSAADPALSMGHGLPGLRERARAVGGDLEVGPVDGGGFRVRAALPLAEGQPSRSMTATS
jgi:signal transduction histidine kinase